jgi:hypothetical protein
MPRFLEKFKENDSHYLSEFKETLKNALHGRKFLRMSDVKFEEQGVDVEYNVCFGYADIGYTEGTYNTTLKEIVTKMWAFSSRKEFRIELKPTIGDDFPAVLRQIKNNGSNVLIIKKYTGTGASYKEFKHFFESQHRTVLKQSEIEAIQVPEFDEIISIEKYIDI